MGVVTQLSERLARLARAKLAIRAALERQGQAVPDGATFESYAERIVGIGCSPKYPDIEYTGSYDRRVVCYGDHWYYEWELRSSGTLSVQGAVTADFYLVGGGGRGSFGSYYTPEGESSIMVRGGGGGAGYALTVPGVRLPETCAVVIGGGLASTTLTVGLNSYTAACGGNGAQIPDSTSVIQGTGYSGVYYGYDDENAVFGTATPQAGSSYGVNGCSRLTQQTGRANGSEGTTYNGMGYGAGSGGTTNHIYAAAMPGVALLRVGLATDAQALTLPAMLDMDMSDGTLRLFTPEGYDGPGFYLNDAGQLVLVEASTKGGDGNA